MTLPKMTEEQRTAALEKARETREQRTAALADLSAGKTSPADFIRNGDPVYARVKVSTFLRKLPGVGKARAQQAMESCSIPEERRLGGLGPRQREALIGWVDENAKA